jgi:CheY-like chemotaxis protein
MEDVMTDRNATMSAGTETILLVEDEEMVRELVSEVLSQSGYTVIEAEDGEEALERFAEQEGHVDLLVTDVLMPRMGGKELAERAKAANPDLKVLFMTGFSDEAAKQQGLWVDEFAYIQKPFTVNSISEKVREVMEPIGR